MDIEKPVSARSYSAQASLPTKKSHESPQAATEGSTVYFRSVRSLEPIAIAMGIDDLISEVVDYYEFVEGLRNMSRAERKLKWQELIRIVEEEICSAVEAQEERIREDEDNCSSGDEPLQ